MGGDDEKPWYESENARYMILLLLVVIIVCAVLAGAFARGRKKAPEYSTMEVIQQPAEEILPEAAVEPVFTPIETPQVEDISCPKCRSVFSIPLEPRPLKVACPDCATKGIIN